MTASLEAPFRAIVFDWDGTAVVDRLEDATALASLLATLLRLDVWLVIVTGTNIANIERQVIKVIPPVDRHHLLICTNHGSEVYGFDLLGTLIRLCLRVATPEEERALTAVAEAVRDAIVAKTNVPIDIVYDRLNRRKIDLIPEPAWTDPPKRRIGELLVAVERRLRDAGLSGGLSAAITLTERLTREHGLPNGRIMSDVKHIEVGLTDKGDSLAWLQRELFRSRGMRPNEVLIAGDEFGPVAGFAGSDDRLRTAMTGTVIVSVGAEPNGVPPGVLLLGGGPPRFRALLADQLRLHQQSTRDWAAEAMAPPIGPTWRLEEHGYRPALEHEVETRFAAGNGFLGVRASLAQPTSASRPRTFVAGLFDTPTGGSSVPALVPGPDWLRFDLRLDGDSLSLDQGEILVHARVLDLPRGLLLGDWRHRDPRGREVRVRTLRFASLANRSLGVQIAHIEVAQPTMAAFDTWLEPPVGGLMPERIEPGLATWHTRRSGRSLAVAHSAVVRLDSRLIRPASSRVLHHQWAWQATPRRAATFVRIVAMARADNEDVASRQARESLRRARRAGVRHLLDAHARTWAARWQASDVVIEGDEADQRALRFATHHLIGAANPDDERVSIGARGLTGDAYLGHVFWDTEIFLLPFYTFTWPAAARAMLMYRFHTLPAARAKAASLGYRGALYAWESADTGEETTPLFVIGPDGEVIRIRCGTDEHHISADIAYAVWQYWQATADAAFLCQAGAEIIVETARFWAGRATLEEDGSYHIRDIIGPDEYHEGVDDNAYTNVMAQWNLERGAEVATLLRARWPERWDDLAGRLRITPDEPVAWLDIGRRMYTGFDPATGRFEQFAGFSALEEIDLAAYEPRTAPMDVLLGREQTQQSQIIKQADVVMLLALLGDRFPRSVRETNFRYYEPRCGHGSSLSPPVHALVAARLGDTQLAHRYVRQAAAIDLDDTMGNAALGIHIATLGGLWQATVLGFAGLGLRPDGLSFDPQLPETWATLRFPVQWRGRALRVELRQEPRRFAATLERGRPLRVAVGEISERLRRGQRWSCVFDESDGQWKEVSA